MQAQNVFIKLIIPQMEQDRSLRFMLTLFWKKRSHEKLYFKEIRVVVFFAVKVTNLHLERFLFL